MDLLIITSILLLIIISSILVWINLPGTFIFLFSTFLFGLYNGFDIIDCSIIWYDYIISAIVKKSNTYPIIGKVKNKFFIVLDPMLATGNSSIEAINLIKRSGVTASNIMLVSLLAAPEGLKNVRKTHPDLKLFTASIDKGLNKNKFIIPGLGDAGDRYMGT